jgi:hypothetical protein
MEAGAGGPFVVSVCREQPRREVLAKKNAADFSAAFFREHVALD